MGILLSKSKSKINTFHNNYDNILLCQPKTNTFNNNNNELTNNINILIITTNLNNIIININDNIYDHLLYLKNDLIGSNINILFTNIFNIIFNNIKIENENNKIILLNKFNNSLYYNVDLIYKKNNYIKYILTKNNLINNINLYNYIKYNDVFINSSNKLIIICIDMINSTNILLNNGIKNTININIRFYNDIKFLINNSYLNYIFIHEIIGDMIILILNHENTFNIKKYCASICLYFIYELINISKKYINIRIGISYDNLYYGYINNNLRLFGKGINLAARLENKCIINNIFICQNFYNKLIEENLFNELQINIINLELKGFNNNFYYTIDLIKNNNIFNKILSKKYNNIIYFNSISI